MQEKGRVAIYYFFKDSGENIFFAKSKLYFIFFKYEESKIFKQYNKVKDFSSEGNMKNSENIQYKYIFKKIVAN